MNPVLPDFTRWQWAGVTERQWFHPLFQQANDVWLELERLSVVKRLRKAAWQFVRAEHLISMTAWAHQHGLVAIPTGYTAQSYPEFRVWFTHPEDAKTVIPWKYDDQKIGELLGFPECCRAAFDRTWGTRIRLDSTFDQAEGLNAAARNPYTSTLLRWKGVRLVPHLPCRYDCPHSRAIGEQFYHLGVSAGYEELMIFIRSVLDWPVHASRLFGISEITTPALRLTVRTDWTPTKEEFTFKGTYEPPQEHWWTDNGFLHPEGMRIAHNTFIDALKSQLSPKARVYDLGCGNGMLLRRLKRFQRHDITIGGMDINADAIGRIPSLSGKWSAEKIQNFRTTDFNPDVVLLNPIRLTEMTRADANAVRTQLSLVPKVYLYTYSDGDLAKVAADAKLTYSEVLRTPEITIGEMQ